MPNLRFPEPWTIHNADDGLIVKDATGLKLVSIPSGELTGKQASDLADVIAKIPNLQRRPLY